MPLVGTSSTADTVPNDEKRCRSKSAVQDPTPPTNNRTGPGFVIVAAADGGAAAVVVAVAAAVDLSGAIDATARARERQRESEGAKQRTATLFPLRSSRRCCCLVARGLVLVCLALSLSSWLRGASSKALSSCVVCWCVGVVVWVDIALFWEVSGCLCLVASLVSLSLSCSCAISWLPLPPRRLLLVLRLSR